MGRWAAVVEGSKLFGLSGPVPGPCQFGGFKLARVRRFAHCCGWKFFSSLTLLSVHGYRPSPSSCTMLGSWPLNKRILRTISATRPDAMVINWLFYCKLIVGMHMSNTTAVVGSCTASFAPTCQITSASALDCRVVASIVYCFYAIVCLLAWAVSVAVDLKQPKMRNEFSNGNWVFG